MTTRPHGYVCKRSFCPRGSLTTELQPSPTQDRGGEEGPTTFGACLTPTYHEHGGNRAWHQMGVEAQTELTAHTAREMAKDPIRILAKIQTLLCQIESKFCHLYKWLPNFVAKSGALKLLGPISASSPHNYKSPLGCTVAPPLQLVYIRSKLQCVPAMLRMDMGNVSKHTGCLK
jgi:hypothetical protein